MIRRAIPLLLSIWLAACGRATGGTRNVVLWHSYQGDERAALEAVIDDFNAHSQDTHIEAVPVAYDAFADKITNAIPNGNGPDIFIFAHDRIGDWVAAGLVEPIEYYVDEKLADHYAYDALAAMAQGGSLYGLPLAVKSVALFYRTDLMPEPPRTTDEMVAWSKAHPGVYAVAYPDTDLYGHAPWLHGFGGRVLTEDGKLDVATPEAARALEFVRSMVRDHVTPKETDAAMVPTLFNEGKAAMAISGPWFIADIDPEVPWAVTTLPVISETGRPAEPFLGAEGVLMSARARDKDRAFEVMATLASDASAISRAKAARQVVPNVAAYDDPKVGNDPELAAFRAQLEHTVPMPATQAMRMVWTPYKTALQAVIAQGADPSAALRDAEQEIRGYLQGASGK